MTTAVASGVGGSRHSGRSSGLSSAQGVSSNGRIVAAVIVIVALGALVIVSSISGTSSPFDLNSSAPDGYKALRELLNQRNVPTRSVSVDSAQVSGAGPGSVIFVPAPWLLRKGDLAKLADAVERGANVIYGALPPSDSELVDDDSTGSAAGLVSREFPADVLAEQAQQLASPSTCTIAALSDLGDIDGMLGEIIPNATVDSPGVPSGFRMSGSCYGEPEAGLFAEYTVGELGSRSGSAGASGPSGTVYVIGSPYLWSNARLGPQRTAREQAGIKEPQVDVDNGLTAWRLLTSVTSGGVPSGNDPELPTASELPSEVLFVRALPPQGVLAGGTQDPLTLLPVSFKVFVAAMAAALGIYVWARAVRLGSPVFETAEVTVESAELTSAIGRLFEGDPAFTRRGVEMIRAEAFGSFCVLTGLPRTIDPVELVAAVARSVGRSDAEVHRILIGDPNGSGSAELLNLEREIEQMREELRNVNAHR